MDLNLMSDEQFQKRLLDIFKKEAIGHVNSLIDGIIEIERRGISADNTAIIDRLFRNAHSLKGSSRTVNILSIEGICQVIEEIFYDIKKGKITITEPLLTSLNKAIKVIERIIDNPTQKIDYDSAIKQLKDIQMVGYEAVTAEDKSPFITDVSESIETEFTVKDDDTYDFVKVQTGALDSLLSKIEETVAFKGFVNDNKQRIASIMQKVKILSKDVDILGSYIHDDFKKILNSINEDLSSILLRDIVFEGFVSNQIDDIIYEIKNISMLPLKDIFEPLPRMVRDLSMAQGKKINITFEGIDARVDRRILEGLRDPIMHIIRNAVDHGIETPDERKQVGKPEIGNIKIRATIETGKKLTLEIIDDGRGIDIHNLRNKLINLGILTSQQSNNIEDSDIIQYVFRPEVSTSKEITHISGRGLGLSIANEAAERLGGFIKVFTEANKGSVFVFSLPLYVTNLKIILFKTSNGTTYGIPTNNVEAVKRFAIDDIHTHEGKEIIQYHDMPISLIPIESVLQMPYDANTDDKYFVALIIRHSEKIVAFRIKEILYEEEISLKDFGYIIKRVKNFSGCATVKSGETILILNPSDLMKSALNTAVIRSIQQVSKGQEIKKKSILLVEDSITARTLFKNILESAGFLVTTAVDGIDALATLKTDNFDLVVTDVQMPRMDGFDLTAKIRADANLFRLPVVLVTGLETRQDKERGMEVGANAYIVKSSFDQSNLVEVINRLI